MTPTVCRFYAHAYFPRFGIIPNPGSNQCALYFDSHTPCQMVTGGHPPDEHQCVFLRSVAGLAQRGGAHSPDPGGIVERKIGTPIADEDFD